MARVVAVGASRVRYVSRQPEAGRSRGGQAGQPRTTLFVLLRVQKANARAASARELQTRRTSAPITRLGGLGRRI